jgi:uracil-DNA glycosylase
MSTSRASRPSHAARHLADVTKPPQTLASAAEAARSCRNCGLWAHATQTVFGVGPAKAALMLVGEQPGDQEDLAGLPFVGPAGHLLDDALEAAGIDRNEVYLTNAVKHFKWKARGKRRIHDKPNKSEIDACSIWLQLELSQVAPDVLILLGATAAKALLGPDFRVTQQHGVVPDCALAPTTIATIHPSSILRQRGPEREVAYTMLVGDLRLATEG